MQQLMLEIGNPIKWVIEPYCFAQNEMRKIFK